MYSILHQHYTINQRKNIMEHFIICTSPKRDSNGMTFSKTEKVVTASKGYKTKAAAASVRARSTYRGKVAVICAFATSAEASAYATEINALIN